MDEELTTEDLAEALRLSNHGKAPGMDGIPYEFYKLLNIIFKQSKGSDKEAFDVLSFLKELYQDIETHGIVSGTHFHIGWLASLFKKGDRALISNYRPVNECSTVTTLTFHREKLPALSFLLQLQLQLRLPTRPSPLAQILSSITPAYRTQYPAARPIITVYLRIMVSCRLEAPNSPLQSPLRPQHPVYRAPTLRPSLLQLPENMAPAALERFPTQGPRLWNTPPPSVNSNVSNPVLASVRSAVNAPESYVKAPGASNTPTDFASIPSVPPRTPLFPEDNLPSPQITGTTTSFTFTSTLSKNPYAPLLSWKLPGRKPRLDSSFSQKMSQHTNSLISSSHLPSYTAEHNTESHDFQSTTTATPIDIDDQALFSSMLNLSPGSPVERTAREDTTPVLPVSQRNSVMEMEKTPFKDHNLQDGRGRYLPIVAWQPTKCTSTC
ncbi:hypothetical protein B0H13DRAFT_2316755 [Mycena leptocephala]|nr:hypothetical protein B0H13DRAFT_2316755 [Mycena leptocephala]